MNIFSPSAFFFILLIAGTTTLAVTQPSYIYESTMSPELEIGDESLFSYFDKPGDCIKRTFPGLLENETRENEDPNKRGLFSKPSSVKNSLLTKHKLTPINALEAQEEHTPPDFACLNYNQHNNFFKLELAMRKDNKGWIWISASRNRKNYLLHFREALVEKDDSGWNAVVGMDGKMTDADNRIFKDTKVKLNTKLITPITIKQDTHPYCRNFLSPCVVFSNTLIWTPNEESERTFSSIASNTSKFIAAFDKKNNHLRNTSGSRVAVYKDKTWIADNKPRGEKHELIVFNVDNIVGTNTKGNWKNLVDFCKEGIWDPKGAYYSYCW